MRQQIAINLRYCQVFLGALGTRVGSLELKIGSLESENYHPVPRMRENQVPRIRKIGSLESEKLSPYKSIPGT